MPTRSIFRILRYPEITWKSRRLSDSRHWKGVMILPNVGGSRMDIASSGSASESDRELQRLHCTSGRASGRYPPEHIKSRNESIKQALIISKRFLIVILTMGASLFAADTYTIDPVHSEIGFRIRHLVAKTSGRFLKFQGSIRMDEANQTKSSVEVRIDSASIATDSEARDKHLRTPEFFDVAKYSELSFKSVAVKEVAKGKLEVTGDFTMHGVTKRIMIPVSILGAQLAPMDKKVHAGFEGALKLNRSEYGISSYPGMLGEEVEINLNIEAIKEDVKQ